MGGVQFRKWQAFMELEPDIGRRIDAGFTELARLICFLAQQHGYETPDLSRGLIEWGRGGSANG